MLALTDSALAQLQRLAQGHQHALGDALGIGFAGQIAKQGDESVAAETGQWSPGRRHLSNRCATSTSTGRQRRGRGCR